MVNSLIKIHKAGVMLWNWDAKDDVVVTVREDGYYIPTIIGLGRGSFNDHPCRFSADRMELYKEIEPRHGEVECPQIAATATECDIWSPGVFILYAILSVVLKCLRVHSLVLREEDTRNQVNERGGRSATWLASGGHKYAVCAGGRRTATGRVP